MTSPDLAATLEAIRRDAANETEGLGPTRRASERDVPRLVASLEAALELHQGVTDGDYPESLPVCEEDGEFSPCPTVLAITTALNGDSDG